LDVEKRENKICNLSSSKEITFCSVQKVQAKQTRLMDKREALLKLGFKTFSKVFKRSF